MIPKYSICVLFFLFACSGSNEFDKTSTYYRNALDAEAQGSYGEAIIWYKKYINLSQRGEELGIAIVRVADIYKNSGAFGEAVKYYKLFLELAKSDDEKNWQVSSVAANLYLNELKDYEKALELYTFSLEKSSSAYQGFISSYGVGKTYFLLFNFEQAVKYLRKAEAEKSDKIDKLLAQEILYYLSYSLMFFINQTKDGYKAQGYGYLDKNDLEQVLTVINKCVNFDAFSKYGVMCQYLKADFLIQNDSKDEAFNILNGLRGFFPNPNVLEYRLKNLEAL